MRQPTVLSIVIVSYNASADLQRCLASLAAAPPTVSFEVLVVDNASSDDSVSRARQFPDVKVLPLPTNVGFAAGNNAGIRASRGSVLLLLNSDTLVSPGAVDAMLDELNHHPEAAIVGPRLVDASGRPEISFGRMLSPLNELRQKRLGHRYEQGDPATVRRVESLVRQQHWPDWVSGACLLVRREAAEAVGLLDERFFMYAEDVDFCASIRARGWGVLFTPSAEIVHLRGRSRASAPAATYAAYRRSQLAFYQKHHPALAPLLRLYQRLAG